MRSLVLFVALSFGPTLAYASCSDDYLTKTSGASYLQILNQSNLNIAKTRHVYLPPQEKDLKLFWQEGWPELKRIANDADISVSEILLQAYESYYFLKEQVNEVDPTGLIKKQLELRNLHLAKLKHATDVLEKLGPKDNLKRKHWQALEQIWIDITDLMFFVVSNEALHKPPTDLSSVNPFAPFTPLQMRNLIDAFEELTVDTVLTLTVAMVDAARSVKEDLERPVIDEKPLTSAAVEVKTELAVPTSVGSAIETLKQIANEIPEPDKPVDLATTDFALVVKKSLPLASGRAYKAQTVYGQSLTVVLEPALIREEDGSEKPVVRRLLRSILTGRGDKSGIKKLSDLGSHIVELKAVMHGHKRIIGCLEGATLTLKFLIDIKDSKATYQRRINPNLCK